MKNLLPLLFLVSCSSYEELQDSLNACKQREDRLLQINEVATRESEYKDAVISANRMNLEACYTELNEAKPKLVALPSPRPQLDLTDCRYVEGRSFCKEVGSKKQGVWVGFDCRRLTADHNFCDARKCMVITSDGKECSL